MKLSEIINEDAILKTDGFFDILAQCTISSDKKILTYLEDINYLQFINKNPGISCVICKPEHINYIENKSIGIVCTEHPKLYFFKIHNELVNKNQNDKSKFKTAVGENCYISPLAYINDHNVIIGNNVIIEEFVAIKKNVHIGDNCIIRSGSIIGSEGFEFKRVMHESIYTVKHAGTTIIEDNVEIKELCTIHQAVFEWDYTKIGEYSKLDAHTHVGHATKIGRRVMIGSHGNLAGNIQIQDDVYIGPGSTISNRLNVGENSKVSLGSVVTKDVENDTIVTGNFAINHDIFITDLKNRISVQKLK
ncbi:UDP-3-O-(3-hydroxymyristoyl)glucosamine N-acyltransferase [Tissierella creatinini]|nr:UDP-3-O-(3-hydroxymyristoyl)glucosamine N-acyltransferase [Tissierella creatinini]TJX61058.1 UDP-3-O-(3-hydroxymyristoyl)glucosamine N-acyltransferase [Soehngenia saccharolytica]